MHIINFFIALIIPWIGLLGFFGPTCSLVPPYFANDEIGLIAAIFGAICGYWLGFFRNFVGYSGKLSEVSYQGLLWGVLLLFVVTKIIYAVPHMWFSCPVGFILGVFGVSKELAVGKYSLWFIAIISIILFGYFGFILTGCAWFDYNMSKFYYFIFIGLEYIKDYLRLL
jgi:hypothetical protein